MVALTWNEVCEAARPLLEGKTYDVGQTYEDSNEFVMTRLASSGTENYFSAYVEIHPVSTVEMTSFGHLGTMVKILLYRLGEESPFCRKAIGHSHRRAQFRKRVAGASQFTLRLIIPGRPPSPTLSPQTIEEIDERILPAIESTCPHSKLAIRAAYQVPLDFIRLTSRGSIFPLERIKTKFLLEELLACVECERVFRHATSHRFNHLQETNQLCPERDELLMLVFWNKASEEVRRHVLECPFCLEEIKTAKQYS